MFVYFFVLKYVSKSCNPYFLTHLVYLLIFLPIHPGRSLLRNPGDFQFCGKCGIILDEAVAVKAEMTEKEHTVELMSEVRDRPNVDDKMKRVEKILDMVKKYPKLAEMLEKEVSETEV